MAMLSTFVRLRPAALRNTLPLHPYPQLQSAKLIPDQLGTTQSHCLFTLQYKNTFKPRHSKDKVPQDYKLIYQNSLKNTLGPCRVFTSVVGIVTAGACLSSIYLYKDALGGWDLYSLSGVCLLSLCGVVFVNVVSRYYLTRIYFLEDSGKFIGIYHSFFGNVKHMKYTAADLELIPYSSNNAQLYTKSNVNIAGRTFHLKAHDFILAKYYNMHTGQV